jgi:hypothetical protein
MLGEGGHLFMIDRYKAYWRAQDARKTALWLVAGIMCCIVIAIVLWLR